METLYYPIVEKIPVPGMKECVWKIKGPIASGVYGTAYTACCEADCKYVLKYIRDRVDYKPRFENEIKIQELAASRGFAPRIFDAWTSDSGYAFVMEKMKTTLADAMKITPREKRIEIAIAGFNAIKQLHSLGYMHGDIHFDNIMLDADDNVKLIDFGFAADVHDPYQNNSDIDKFIEDLFMNYHYLILLGESDADEAIAVFKEIGHKPAKDHIRALSDGRGSSEWKKFIEWLSKTDLEVAVATDSRY
jgi:serine/threonine protein kinase